MQNLITDEEWKMLSAESRHRLNLLLAYPCEWQIHDEEANAWESACGLVWWFEVGSPAENEMAYCPKCGRHLTQRAVDEGDSSAPEGDASPEVLPAGEAGSTPALHH